MDHDEEIIAYRFRHKVKPIFAISIDAEGKDFPDPEEWHREETISISRTTAPGFGLDRTVIDHLKSHSFVILAGNSAGDVIIAPRKDDRGD